MVIPVGDICDSDRCLLGTMSLSHVAKPQAGDIWRHLSLMSTMSPQRGDVKLAQPRQREGAAPRIFHRASICGRSRPCFAPGSGTVCTGLVLAAAALLRRLTAALRRGASIRGRMRQGI